jgi:hypothetical protein
MDPKKRKILITILSFLLICLLVWSVAKFLSYAENLNQARLKIGVVDLNKLLPLHSDWSTLKSLDTEILNLEDKINNGNYESGIEKYRGKKYQYLQQEQKKAEIEMAKEFKKAQQELNYQQEQLEKALEEESTGFPGQPGNLAEPYHSPTELKKLQKYLEAYARDLYFLKDRQAAAYRLEQEKSLKADLDAKQQNLLQELTSFEQNLLKSHQNKRLNLVLKLQTPASAEELKNTQTELKTMEDEENTAKEVQRKENEKIFERYKADAVIEHNKKLTAFSQTLEKNLQFQINKERLRLAGLPVDNYSFKEAAVDPKNLQREYETKKQAIAHRLNALRQSYLQRLETKRQKLNQNLIAVEKELNLAMQKETQSLQSQEQERNLKFSKELENLKTERAKLYDNIMKELKTEIIKVARNKGIFLVLTGYFDNIDGIDLTSESEVLIKKLRL